MTGLFSVLKMTNASPSFSPNIALAWARLSVSEEERKMRASREKAIEQWKRERAKNGKKRGGENPYASTKTTAHQQLPRPRPEKPFTGSTYPSLPSLHAVFEQLFSIGFPAIMEPGKG